MNHSIESRKPTYKSWHSLAFFILLLLETATAGAFWISFPSFDAPWLMYKVGVALFVFVQWPIYFLFHIWYTGQVTGPWKSVSLAWKVRWQFLITVVLSFLLLSLVQYWFAKIPWEWSLSEDSQQRINEYTKNSILRFDHLKVIYFADNTARKDFLPWLLFLKRKFSSIVTIEVIDPSMSPTLLERYQIQKVPAITLITNRGTQSTYEISEVAFTQSIIKILRPQRPMICFTSQHGEYSLQDQSPQGLSYFKQVLQNERMGVREWKFSASDAINVSDVELGVCDYLVVMGPQRDLSKWEMNQFLQLLKDSKLKGVLISLEQTYPTKIPHWEQAFASAPIGLKFSQGIILDQTSPEMGLEASVVTGFIKESKWINDKSGKMVFPMARSLVWESEGPWKVLMESQAFPKTWLETDVKTLFASGKAVFQKGIDTQGTFPLIIMKESIEPRKRWLAVASARVVLNGYQGQVSNFQNLLNLLSWGLFLDQEISMDRPQLESHSLTFVASQLQLLFYLSVVVIPFFMLALAFWFWRREKASTPRAVS